MIARRLFPLVAALLLVACSGRANAPKAHALLGLTDLDGRPQSGWPADGSALVLVFVRSDCPISNRYMPELNALEQSYEARGVTMNLVYLDAAESRDAIERHHSEYHSRLGLLRDPQHRVVELVGAKVTPSVALFDRDDRLVYAGRIDDRMTDYGKGLAEPSRRDLAIALDELLSDRPVSVARTDAVGCLIEDLK